MKEIRKTTLSKACNKPNFKILYAQLLVHLGAWNSIWKFLQSYIQVPEPKHTSQGKEKKEKKVKWNLSRYFICIWSEMRRIMGEWLEWQRVWETKKGNSVAYLWRKVNACYLHAKRETSREYDFLLWVAFRPQELTNFKAL